MSRRDPINDWIDNNTGIYGLPTPYSERREKKDDFDELVEATQSKKRFVYEAWYLQYDSKRYRDEWMSIGKYEINHQDEILDLVEKLEQKYQSRVRTSLVKRNW